VVPSESTERNKGKWMKGALAALLCWLLTSAALADARTDFLMRMLATSSQFRVRAQAALALGSQSGEKEVVVALSRALKDEHPAVRAASASALERLRDASAIPALKSAQNDRDGSVRTAVRSALAVLNAADEKSEAAEAAAEAPSPSGGPFTYYIGIGVPGSQVGLSKDVLEKLRGHVSSQVSQLTGVRLAPANEDRKAAERVIRTQKLVGFYIDSSIVSIETKADGSIRAQVSVIVGTYPGRDIRAMLSGAATMMGGGSSEQAKVQVIQAAFQGALRRLPQALEAGLARAQQ
jgi:hypothetical protein